MSINRRQFLQLSAATLCGALPLSGCQSAENRSSQKQVNIYSWADYLHPDTIPTFERRTGIKVVYDTVASNEALIAKFEAGAADYDVIVPSNYAVTKLRALKRLQPIDHEKLPNFKYLIKRFANPSYDPGCKYSIPYTFGTTGIAYNKNVFPSQKPPDHWDAFWDKNLQGRITLLEDARETIGMALKRLGHSVNTTDPAIVELGKQDLIVQKPLTMCYSSDQVIIYLASGDSLLSLAYSGDAHQARRTNSDVGYVIPTEGASMWVDTMCIPVSAPHPDNALKWIDYMLEPEVSALNCNYTYYATPNQDALKMIKPELLAEKSLYPPASVLDKCEEIRDIGEAIFIYDRMWTELKCV